MATYYVTQSGAGSGTGTSLGNAFSVSGHNAATFAAGDIIHLNAAQGSFTSTLVPPSSGSIGNPITYIFDSGAKFSKAFWSTTTGAAIYATAISYIVIDGNFTGIIECTANGDALANQQQSHGIYIIGCNDVEIKQLTIQNIFVHTYGTANPAGVNAYTTLGVKASGCNRISLNNCTIHDAYSAIYFLTETTVALSTLNVFNNTVSACSTTFTVGLGSTGSSIDAVNVYKNDVTMGLNWYDGAPNLNHVDGLHAFAIFNTNDAITNLQCYSNYFHGDPGTQCTSPIFLEYGIISPRVYNNLVVGSTNHPTQGYTYIKMLAANTTASNPKVLNNTYVGLGSSASGGIGLCFDAVSNMTMDAYNNIYQNCFVGLYVPANVGTINSNYNDYFGCGSVAWTGSSYTTLANWQAATLPQGGTGADLNSQNTDPNLNGSFFPVATSAAIGTGTNLSGTFTTDKNGSIRGTPWWMGCYQTAGSIISNGYKRIGRYLHLFGPSA